MKNFKQLIVWQKGFEIATQCFRLVESFPSEHKFGLSNQVTRAAISVPSNIAEGSSRTSAKDYKRFLEHSLGSCFEIETQLLISEAVNYGSAQLRAKVLRDVDEEEKMLMAFIRKLNK